MIKKDTFLSGNITWSEMRRQRIQAKKAILAKVLSLRLQRYRTIFRSAEKFHRPLRSHEAVQYFRYVHTEF